MQNKGLIKLFALLFGLVSIFQLSFTYIANRVENKAKAFAEAKVSNAESNYVSKRERVESQYLDSMLGQDVYNIGITKYTYAQVKDKELNRGLDLKGGINVILQISVKDILKGLANNTKDPIFNKSLAEADELLRKTDRTYLDLFFESYEKNGGKLASPDVFANKTLSEEINFQMSDSEVRPIIKRKVDESVTSAFEVLRKRIDKFGVSQPNIQRLGASGRILIELPGAKDVTRIKSLLQSTAQLEFWETFKNIDVLPYISAVNETLKSTIKPQESVSESTTNTIDSLLTDIKKDSIDQAKQINPLFDLFKPVPTYEGSPVLFAVSLKDTAKVNNYLRSADAKRLLPANLQFAKFVWGKPSKDSDLVEMYALKSNRDNVAALTGNVITDAAQTYDVRNQPAVSMQMDGKGARIWESLTDKAFKEQGNIAIVLDDIVYSAPGVTNGAITGGRSEITGTFTLNEAIDLANVLRAGKLPAGADIVQSEVVGPSLGQEAIDSGMNSFLIAAIIIFAWMIFYYGRAGIYADIALVFNILLVFGVLASINAVLTLPGIAGIVLTIGMAIDANVLIFERIKEELDKGKGVSQAVSDGFGNALSSILDANITTGLTALILLAFGSGPIQGFATTLLIGIATTLFTAIFITRLLIDYSVEKKHNLTFSTNLTKNILKNVNIDFIKKRKVGYIISAVAILVSIISLSTKGLNQGIDFVGGRTYQIRFEHPVVPAEISKELQPLIGNVEVKTFGSANQIKIATKYKVEEESTAVDNEIQELLYKGLQKFLPQGYSYEDFVGASAESSLGIVQSMKVGPTIAEDIKSNAVWSVLGALVVIAFYILIRFRRWQFSLGTVVPSAHDVILVLGVFSLTYSFMPFNMEIDQAFIAAILTVVGYSLNDTVIIYDRIREYMHEPNWTKEKINTALNSTLSRTLNTSLTTLAVLVTIFIFGGETLRGFMFAMIVGVVVGTYSSIFIAAPMLYDTLDRKSKKEESHS
ncbi:protein translocase subunit SecDF [Capnocytophaga cynodegmi]|uniref:Multifunctional fusion protein n=1 Tax=Capnocytophaga cynodegmi TaxID=28189 RepID=A0A0B7HDS3_9FLAO|nr:protein translocase subunit SecDF [Capnocytophaga cynodegmi]CEN35059.1 Protein-export membrane protein secD [Capnocytophaga cynodegmi]CEN35693.1 Protein-export membrane protein secD [Capnocytophaga cynodegmi]